MNTKTASILISIIVGLATIIVFMALVWPAVPKAKEQPDAIFRAKTVSNGLYTYILCDSIESITLRTGDAVFVNLETHKLDSKSLDLVVVTDTILIPQHLLLQPAIDDSSSSELNEELHSPIPTLKDWKKIRVRAMRSSFDYNKGATSCYNFRIDIT